MATGMAAFWQHLLDRHGDDGRMWRFRVRRLPAQVAWQWELVQAGVVRERSQGDFPSFADCARDAQEHGFEYTQPYTLTDGPAMVTFPRPYVARPSAGSDAYVH